MTSETTASSAATKVFNTFELVEKIVLHCILDVDSSKQDLETRALAFASKHGEETLFGLKRENGEAVTSFYNSRKSISEAETSALKLLHRVQRVSTAFQGVIARSKQLRQRMYHDFEDDDTESNSASRRQRNVWGPFDSIRWCINPLASHFDKLAPVELHEPYFTVGNGGAEDVQYLDFHFVADDLIEEKQQHTLASWRKMLLTKRPVKLGLEINVVRQQPAQNWVDADWGVGVDLTAHATLGEVADQSVKAARVMTVDGAAKEFDTAKIWRVVSVWRPGEGVVTNPNHILVGGTEADDGNGPALDTRATATATCSKRGCSKCQIM